MVANNMHHLNDSEMVHLILYGDENQTTVDARYLELN